jgi:hypothetical protein
LLNHRIFSGIYAINATDIRDDLTALNIAMQSGSAAMMPPEQSTQDKEGNSFH